MRDAYRISSCRLQRSGADLEGSHHQETILSSMLHRFGAINTSGGGSMHGGSHYGATGGLGATNRGGGVYGGLGALGGSAHDGVGWLMMRAQGAPGAKAAPEQVSTPSVCLTDG